ncbi:MAG: DUF2189 domain-containing protein [Alphaproteobacteria bacterium]|nr:DUF2189 domain-containing protein [Alphaproteobacteria bacterium]
MSNEQSIDYADSGPARPTVRKIDVSDLKEALVLGFKDFDAKPTHIMLLFIIYPIVGVILINLSAGYQVLPLIFPIIAGFALIGPMAAVGLYEISRRREAGLDYSIKYAFQVHRSPSIGAIITLSLIMMVIYFAWLGSALLIFNLTFGETPTSFWGFAREVISTPAGWTLIIVGGGVGGVFAVVVLALSVVSFPMLLDHDVSAAVAISTSVRAVAANPVTMAIWGFIVSGALILGSIPAFFGLAVAMPVLGHATWHLYRKVVEV